MKTAHFRRGPHIMPADVPDQFMTGHQWQALWNQFAANSHSQTDGLIADAAFHRGVLHMTAGKTDLAESDFLATLRLDPNMAAAACNLGVIYHGKAAAAGSTAKARPFYDAANQFLRMAARVRPTDPAIWTGLGAIERERGNFARAEQFHKRAIELAADFPDAWFNLGRLYLLAVNPYTTAQNGPSANHFATEAARAFAQYSTLRPQDPDGWTNQGAAVLLAGDPSTSATFFRHALTIDPNNGAALENLGTTTLHAGDYDGAIALLRQAAAINPENYRARFRLALTMLQYEDFRAGFWEYQVRFNATISTRDFVPALPEWTGEPLTATPAARLLIWSEQGPGDQILFMSALAEAVTAAGVPATFLCKPQLYTAASRCFGHVPSLRIVSFDTDKADGWPDIGATHHIAIGSLFGLFRRSTRDFITAANRRRQRMEVRKIARAAGAPYLWPLASKALSSRYEFATVAAGRRKIVGISWHSSAPHVGTDKSIPAATFARALTDPDAFYVSLQYGKISDADKAALPNVHFTGRDYIGDFESFLADAAACDEILTISNTTAHAGGAMGIPTTLLLSHDRASLWYWFRERANSPIYPSIKIFRGDFATNWYESAIAAYVEHRDRQQPEGVTES